ncbi:hypothetical protein MFIFM68171_07011 [Madurella fahalii]|uniref:Uncharacterized protein n=1 Tax=Madurella fahalii TaxID=1157608 RepID=A0ABQ0GGA6_9PEZI
MSHDIGNKLTETRNSSAGDGDGGEPASPAGTQNRTSAAAHDGSGNGHGGDVVWLGDLMDPFEFASFSHSHWPNAEVDPPGRSGIVCAVIILRHLLFFLDGSTRAQILSEALGLQCSPLLLEAACLNDDEDFALSCERIKRRVGSGGLSFESLMESQDIKEALWLTEDCRLLHSVFHRPGETSPWGDVPEGLRLPPWEDGLLRWDGITNGTLSAHVASYFGVFSHPETDDKILRMPGAPKLIRIRYSSRNPNQQFYHDLSHFEFRLPNTVDHPSGSRITYYRCVAAVKLRDSPEGADTLRLYDYWGAMMYLNSGAFPLSDAWRIHEGGEYMLYFVHTGVPLAQGESSSTEIFELHAQVAANRRFLARRFQEIFGHDAATTQGETEHTPIVAGSVVDSTSPNRRDPHYWPISLDLIP